MTNYYLEILGLQPGASPGEIKATFRKLAKQYHPDVNQSEEAKQRFIEIHEAYKFLEDVGPRPANEKVNYDFNPQQSEYDLRRERARAFAQKKAREDEIYKRTILTKVYKVFNYVVPVVILLNLILAADYLMQEDIYHESVVDYREVYEIIPNTSYKSNAFDIVYFESFSISVPPNELEKVPDLSNAEVSFTPILQIFCYARFGTGESAVVITPEYNIYDVFVGLTPLLLIGCLAYLLLSDWQNNKMSVLLFIIFGLIIELTIFFSYKA